MSFRQSILSIALVFAGGSVFAQTGAEPRRAAVAAAVDVVLEAKRRSRVHAPPDGARTRPRDQGLRDAQNDLH